MSKPKLLFIGCYIVTDPKICHGKPTFRGTRVLVSDVLEQVGNGMAWETIIEEWNGSITRDAISEAVVSVGEPAGQARLPNHELIGFESQSFGERHSRRD